MRFCTEDVPCAVSERPACRIRRSPLPVSRRSVLNVARIVASLLAARGAGAAESSVCGESPRPWVQIVTEDVPGSHVAFVSLLRAELASRGLDLCASSTDVGAPPVATIRVSARPDAVALTVEVRDALTEKQVNRDVALAGIPPDGQPLTLALAADELLRASWAELTLRTAPPPDASGPRR